MDCDKEMILCYIVLPNAKIRYWSIFGNDILLSKFDIYIFYAIFVRVILVLLQIRSTDKKSDLRCIDEK